MEYITRGQFKLLKVLPLKSWKLREQAEIDSGIGKSFSTTLTRLVDKGLVRRRKNGRKNEYQRRINFNNAEVVSRYKAVSINESRTKNKNDSKHQAVPCVFDF